MRRGSRLFFEIFPLTNPGFSFLPEQKINTPLAERVVNTAYNGKQPTLFRKTPFLHLQQITPISDYFSDHRGYLIDMGCGKVLSLNWLMRMIPGKNGFNGLESHQEYIARLLKIAETICDILREHNVVILMAQEFAIKEEDIQFILNVIRNKQVKGWENPDIHLTEFGLMTCFKNGEIKKAFLLNEKLAENLGTYAIRCHAFNPNEVYTIANTHIPFHQTEVAFKKMVHLLIEEKMVDGDKRLKMIDFIGDKNLSPEIQASLIEEVFNEIRKRRELNEKNPITFISYTLTSPDGHQKMNDGNPVNVNVDSINRFVFFESSEYAFHAISDKSAEGTYRRLLALLLGGTSIAAYTFDESITAQFGTALLSM